jgi:hypothetical protein
MNKLEKTGRAKLYGQAVKFQTYESPGTEVQIRTPKGVVVMLPTMGGQFATRQNKREAVRLARKIVRFLNA